MSLKYALLGFLAESPKYGYEIKQKFEGALGNVWSVSYGQLYPTLRRLSELEWVTKKTAPGKKAAEKNIYSLTAKGRKKLDEWLLRPLRSNYKVKDEFTLKFLFFNKLPRDPGRGRSRPLCGGTSVFSYWTLLSTKKRMGPRNWTTPKLPLPR